MRHFAIPAVLLLTLASPAAADVFQDDLTRCMVNAASDQDKSAFMVWMFSAISSDPKLQKMTTLDRAQRDKIGSDAAAVFQRLLFVDCRKEAIAVLKTQGANALAESFGGLGETATEQMFRSPEAQRELEALGKGFDDKKLEALGREAGIPESQLKK